MARPGAKAMKKIAFVVQLPREVSPGQRFRCEQYEHLLKNNGFQVETFPFLDNETYQILYKEGYFLRKVVGVFKGFVRRIGFLFKARKFDYIFLQREMAPVGPPVFEWIVSKILKAKIIYDYDDAIWIPNVSEGNRIARFAKCFWKIKWICKWSYKVSAGNDFLANYARSYNNKVVVNPTCVDTENKYFIASQQNEPPVIGWTGSHSTIQFLALGIPAIKKLGQLKQFRFLAICDKKPEFDIKSLEFQKWDKQTEIEDLSKINIGIMPLKEDAWSEGKCGFKLIQYMALGIPAVASPVGVNKQIIDHGINGYLCSSDEEWIQYLTELLSDEQKRREFGKKGRDKIVREYSIQSNASNFLSLFSN
ncbi:MAG: glycosyltransferase family 4 protein [Flavisolibacter sp.]|nr:glycosyltransferase family 4 protein [Flavisolibacter sp.]